MKFSTVMLTCVCFMSVGCATTQAVQGENEATTGGVASGSLDDIIGKSLVSDNGTVFIVGADGTMGGTLNGEQVVGVYVREGSAMCSTYTSPKTLSGREFCSTPVFENGTVVFHRRDGTKSQTFRVE